MKNGSIARARTSGVIPEPVSEIAIITIIAGGDLVLRRGIAGIEQDVRGFDGQTAAHGHGIAPVDREIQHGAFDLIGVGQAGPEIGGEAAFQFDVLAQGPTQQILHIGDQAVDVVLA